MNAPAIVLSRVGIAYADRVLFEDLSLHLPAGRTTCILGPSGCGKSTLLKLLAGEPGLSFSGEVRLEPGGEGLMAWMGQKDLLLPWFSLLDNVLLGARLRREITPRKREKAHSLIRAAGLAGSEHLLPASLSGGMRQRAVLLRTLMEERPVILMDEPFSALDALTRLRLQNLAANMTTGATVVLVTHDPLEALRLGHRLIVLGGTPTRAVSEIDPPGLPPRAPDHPETMRLYAELLEQLMGGETA